VAPWSLVEKQRHIGLLEQKMER